MSADHHCVSALARRIDKDKDVQGNSAYLFPRSPSSQPPPQTFAEALARVEALLLADFDREIVQKQLYYHNHHHVNTVRRRARKLLDALRPFLVDCAEEELARVQGLLDLCAMAHDAIQLFEPQDDCHASRRREAGRSEMATLERLLDYIRSVNQSLDPSSPARFTDADLHMVREAIIATICHYDPADQAIYQPSLYQTDRALPLVAHLLALADIGALGVDGVEFYNQEGSLLFLEENPDLIALIGNGQMPTLRAYHPNLYENLRQRLLRRARFQVSFARSRLARYPHEVRTLPVASLPALRHQVFKYLTEETVHIVESTTPTDEDTAAEVLVEFFQFEQYLKVLV